MSRKVDNKGISLVELIVAIAIMAILVGVIAPQMFKYVERAKQVKVEKEASEIMRAAQVALVSVTANGKEPKSDSIKHKIKDSSSPYYKNGTLYGNITNWSVHNGMVPGYSNVPFGEEFLTSLGIVYGEGWRCGSSSVPVSEKRPKDSQSGSLTKECIFLVFYDKDGNMVVEYSREGYFVRMENSLLVESTKIASESENFFTPFP